VLKLLKAFPELQVIVVALMSGLSSIFYIAVILGMVFYIFGIVAMILFAKNDPWHFGNLHLSIISLFRASTLEDWTDIMYTNSFGCYNYQAYQSCDALAENYLTLASRESAGSAAAESFTVQANIAQYCGEALDLGHTPGCCCAEHSASSGIWSYIFFLIFEVLGALTLMTLFIGVITTSMEKAQTDNDKQRKITEAVHKVMAVADVNVVKMVRVYRLAFDLINTDHGDTVGLDELRDALKVIDMQANESLPSLVQLADMLPVAGCSDEAVKTLELGLLDFVKLLVFVGFQGGNLEEKQLEIEAQHDLQMMKEAAAAEALEDMLDDELESVH
jgi:hypothetical protein